MIGQIAVGALAMVGLHLVIAQIRRRSGVWQIVACGVAGGLMARVIGPCSWSFTVCVQAFLLMLYLHFYVGVDRSVSLRILHELAIAPERTLTAGQLEQVYPRRYMFEHRIALLTQKSWLHEESGRYVSAHSTLPLVWATRGLRSLFGLRETW